MPDKRSLRNLPRWATPMAGLPTTGSAQARYAALAAGREGQWLAISVRIATYCFRLRRDGHATESASRRLARTLDHINDRACKPERC